MIRGNFRGGFYLRTSRPVRVSQLVTDFSIYMIRQTANTVKRQRKMFGFFFMMGKGGRNC